MIGIALGISKLLISSWDKLFDNNETNALNELPWATTNKFLPLLNSFEIDYFQRGVNLSIISFKLSLLGNKEGSTCLYLGSLAGWL